MKKIYTAFLFISALNFQGFSQAPVIDPISGPSAVCSQPAAAQTFSTFATNASGYNWSVVPSAGVTIVGNGPAVSISFPNTNSTYMVYCYAINSSGASAIVSHQVDVFEMPTVLFSGASVICHGDAINLSASSTILYSASSSLSYVWSPSTGLNTTNSPYVTAMPAATTTYTIQVTLGNCVNTYNRTVAVTTCVGIKSNTQDNHDELSIYPNPNVGTFILRSPRTEKVLITDELGRLVRQVELIANEDTEIRELNPGIYFLNIRFSKNKIVVTR